MEKAKKVADEAIVKDLAQNMVEHTLSVYGRKESVVREVLNSMRVQEDRIF